MFADHAPFNELPEGIEIKELDYPYGMAASATARSLFISDNIRSCVWVIELPNHVLKEFDAGFWPSQMSITPYDELLVVVEDKRKRTPPVLFSYSISIFRLSDFSQMKSIPIPHIAAYVSCAAQLPNKNIIISYVTDYSLEDNQWISILSTDGEVIRKFDPNVFESIRQNPWSPDYFAIKENGDIFIMDGERGRIYWFNSQLTDYQLISCNDHAVDCPQRIVYVKDRGQLLVLDVIGPDDASVSHLLVFHLGPCNLIQRRNDEGVTVTKITRKRKALDFTSKYRKLWFQKKQKLLL